MQLPVSRQNNFNLLRLGFALLVLLSHAPEMADGDRSREILTQVFGTLSFGELAVDGFFILSGYLIVQSFASRPHIVTFLKSRILRIYPAFIIATLVSVFIVGPLGASPALYFSQLWLGGLVKNLAFLGAPVTPEVFAGTSYASVNGAMWTISYEFSCYLLVLVLGLLGAIRNRGVWLALTVGLLALFLAQNLGVSSATGSSFVRLSMHFFCGGCFFLYRNKITLERKYSSIFGCILFPAMFVPHCAELAVATAGAYLLLHFAKTPIPTIAWINKLPDVSYGVYLYGWPVQKLLLWYFPDISPWLLFAISVGCTLILGAISWFAIEKPALSFKSANQRAIQRPPAKVGLAENLPEPILKPPIHR